MHQFALIVWLVAGWLTLLKPYAIFVSMAQQVVMLRVLLPVMHARLAVLRTYLVRASSLRHNSPWLGVILLVGQSSCQMCLPGYYADTPRLSNCNACPRGRAQSSINGTFCFECQPGTFQSSEGQSNCNDCPPGEVSAGFGAIECVKCQAGEYTPSPKHTVCIPCSAVSQLSFVP